jgi:hypothetical protein
MSTDFAASLRTVVEERLAVARAAGSTSRPSPRMIGRYADWHTEPFYTSDDEPYAVLIQTPLGQFIPAEMPARIAAHIALNDPADAILACERDLGVLDRHARTFTDTCEAGCREWYPYPDPEHTGPPDDGEWRSQGWPCAEVASLARRYGLEVGGG